METNIALPDLTNVSLTLFLTKGNTLRTWVETGSFEREIALYRRLRPYVARLSVVSYGGPDELDMQEKLGDIEVIANHLCLPPRRYYVSLVGRLKPRAGEFPVFKSNQVPGAEFAVAAARFRRGKSIARCGFLVSDFARREFGEMSRQAKRARLREAVVFKFADQCVVTTDAMARSLQSDYSIDPAKIEIIPNYVDTDMFKPLSAEKTRPRSLCFVGRLEEQKNPLALVRALQGQNLGLTIIGEGGLKNDVAKLATELGVQIEFLSNVANERLPEIINSAMAFVLPSLYEGHPKALIEAMGCGVPIITTKVPGIENITEDGKTAILCDISADSLRKGISRVAVDPVFAAEIGAAARTFVVNNYSLDKTAEHERRLIGGLIPPRR